MFTTLVALAILANSNLGQPQVQNSVPAVISVPYDLIGDMGVGFDFADSVSRISPFDVEPSPGQASGGPTTELSYTFAAKQGASSSVKSTDISVAARYMFAKAEASQSSIDMSAIAQNKISVHFTAHRTFGPQPLYPSGTKFNDTVSKAIKAMKKLKEAGKTRELSRKLDDFRNAYGTHYPDQVIREVSMDFTMTFQSDTAENSHKLARSLTAGASFGYGDASLSFMSTVSSQSQSNDTHVSVQAKINGEWEELSDLPRLDAGPREWMNFFFKEVPDDAAAGVPVSVKLKKYDLPFLDPFQKIDFNRLYLEYQHQLALKSYFQALTSEKAEIEWLPQKSWSKIATALKVTTENLTQLEQYYESARSKPSTFPQMKETNFPFPSIFVVKAANPPTGNVPYLDVDVQNCRPSIVRTVWRGAIQTKDRYFNGGPDDRLCCFLDYQFPQLLKKPAGEYAPGSTLAEYEAGTLKGIFGIHDIGDLDRTWAADTTVYLIARNGKVILRRDYRYL